MTLKTGTETTWGFIEHLELDGVLMPVKLNYPPSRNPHCVEGLRPPKIVDDCVVFVKPGGIEYLSNIVMTRKSRKW